MRRLHAGCSKDICIGSRTWPGTSRPAPKQATPEEVLERQIACHGLLSSCGNRKRHLSGISPRHESARAVLERLWRHRRYPPCPHILSRSRRRMSRPSEGVLTLQSTLCPGLDSSICSEVVQKRRTNADYFHERGQRCQGSVA